MSKWPSFLPYFLLKSKSLPLLVTLIFFFYFFQCRDKERKTNKFNKLSYKNELVKSGNECIISSASEERDRQIFVFTICMVRTELLFGSVNYYISAQPKEVLGSSCVYEIPYCQYFLLVFPIFCPLFRLF